jgi:hypothetical protein
MRGDAFGLVQVLYVLAETREDGADAFRRVAWAAAIISSNDSPCMNFETARRTNGSLVPFARSH